jgi:hypothetical protein
MLFLSSTPQKCFTDSKDQQIVDIPELRTVRSAGTSLMELRKVVHEFRLIKEMKQLAAVELHGIDQEKGEI